MKILSSLRSLFSLALIAALAACGGGGGGGAASAIQSITFNAAPALVAGGTGTVSATGGASGNAVTFSSSTTGICTISGSTVSGVTVGTCTIAANQAGNANFNAAPQVTQNITVSAAVVADSQAPVVSSVSRTTTAGNTVTLTATASDNIGVTGYCFKTSSTTPAASDACFQVSSSKTGVALPSGTTYYVWARDAAGNVSGMRQGFCSAAGFTASDASTKNTVCMMTDMGEVVLELDATKAPITVANFLHYVTTGFLDTTTFHRVIPTFMIQGGGFTYANGVYSQKTPDAAAIALEKTSTTGLSNVRGSIAMARTSVANSATSQFFINVVDNLSLDSANQPDGNGYAVFGKVISGLNVVDLIKAVPTGAVGIFTSDAPITPVLIQWANQLK